MKRGDIVLAQFPHAAGTPAKNRPVLVVQADYYNQQSTYLERFVCLNYDESRTG